MALPRARIVWATAQGELVALEPFPREVQAHAAELAADYNEPHNRSMMGHDPMSIADVTSFYGERRPEASRLFLLFRDGALVGDADLRGIGQRIVHGIGHGVGTSADVQARAQTHAEAEFAFMIGGRSSQGRGLGTRFAVMLHAFGFRTLGLGRIYVTILAANKPSQRVFEKLGYQIDDRPEVRAAVDHHDDLSMSISREQFEERQAASLGEIHIAPREDL